MLKTPVLSSDFLPEGLWSLKEAAQPSLLPGTGPGGPSAAWSWRYGNEPKGLRCPCHWRHHHLPQSLLENQTFSNFVRPFGAAPRKQGHAPPQSHLSMAAACGVKPGCHRRRAHSRAAGGAQGRPSQGLQRRPGA